MEKERKTTVYKKGLLFLMIVICFFLIGCSKEQDSASEEVDASADMTYDAKDIVLQGILGEIEQCRRKGDSLYVLTKQEETSHLYKANMDGSGAKEIPLPIFEENEVNSFYIDSEDNIFCLIQETEEKGQQELIKINMTGEIIVQTKLQELLSLDGESLLSCMTIDGLDNIILSTETMVYSLDSNLQLVDKVVIEDQYRIKSFCKTKSGKIVCGMIEVFEDGGEGSSKLCILDTENGEWGSSLPGIADGHFWIDETTFAEGQAYEFYYKGGFGVYGYDQSNDNWKKILDARCSLLTTQDVEGIIIEEQGQFLGLMSTSSNGEEGTVIELYSKMNAEEEDDKKIITVATYNVQDPLRRVAREFNKTHNDCKIEIILYEDEDHTKLGQDIAMGKIPDVFDPFEAGMSMEQLIEKGILEDLTPYYEKDDVICIEDIYPSVWETMKNEGKVYITVPYFSLWSAASRKGDVGDRTGWTLAEIREILSEKGQGAFAFDSLDKAMILSNVLLGNLNDYIDWGTGECSFDSQEFREILEFCNEGILTDQMTEAEYLEMIDEIGRKQREGKVLMEVEQSVSLESIQMARCLFDSDITYIGLPQSDRQGSYMTFEEQYGIYSGSELKEEAWEFIRMTMSEEYQTNVKLLKFTMFPTRKDCLEWNIQTKMATEPYEDRYGNWIEPVDTETWVTDYGTKVKTGPASQEDVDVLMDLINRTNKQVSMDDEATTIVFEEATKYFYGDMSLDKTVQIIQKRVETYVNEQR